VPGVLEEDDNVLAGNEFSTKPSLTMLSSTKPGIAFVMAGLVVPRIIDAIETAYSLDIKRDVGVLPWLILTIAGVGLLLRS
jgi:hypothetical protein